MAKENTPLKKKNSATRKNVLKGKHVEISGKGKMDAATYDLFVSTPLFWLGKSEELLLSANILNSYQDAKMKTHTVGNNVFSVVRLLCGYSLENIFKAIIAPTAVAKTSGKLPEILNDHNLKNLCKSAGVVINKDQGKILDFLTEHTLSYGRYHIHVKADKMQNSSKIGAHQDLFKEVVVIWNLARAKIPGYTHF